MSAVVKRPDGRYNLRCGPEKFCWVVKKKKKKSVKLSVGQYIDV